MQFVTGNVFESDKRRAEVSTLPFMPLNPVPVSNTAVYQEFTKISKFKWAIFCRKQPFFAPLKISLGKQIPDNQYYAKHTPS